MTRIRNWLAARRFAWRQRWCRHEKRMADVMRVAPDLVVCPCRRCGKLLQAEYGIILPGRWVA